MSDIQGIVSPAYYVYRKLHSGNNTYFHNLFRSLPYITGYNSISKGIRVGQWDLEADKFRLFPVLIPPREEQDAIVAHLDHATTRIDALVTKKTHFIELLREKRQALITRTVTRGLDPEVPMKDSGVAWLGQVPAHWQVPMLRRIVATFEQGWSPDCHSHPKSGEGWGVVKAGCVNGGFFDANQNKAIPDLLAPRPELELKHGDILMSRASGSPTLIGSVAQLDRPPARLMLSDKIFRLRLNTSFSASYFVWLMASFSLRAQIELAISGADGLANNLAQAKIKEFRVTAPPPSEQDAISRFLDLSTTRIDTLIAKTERSIELLREKRIALITAAVTGKLDLRKAA